jgi:hypothetical protein
MAHPPSRGSAARAVAAGSASASGTLTTSGTPADFAAKNLGAEMKALPRLGADGKIELQLSATVKEFEGFVEFADGSSADGARVTVDSAVYQPIFSTRETTVTERVTSGRAILFKLGRLKRVYQPMSADGARIVTQVVPDATEENIVLVLVTATEVPLPKALANAGAEAAKANL